MYGFIDYGLGARSSDFGDGGWGLLLGLAPSVSAHTTETRNLKHEGPNLKHPKIPQPNPHTRIQESASSENGGC